MKTITKDDFLTMVKLQHLEVLTHDQFSQNTDILKGHLEKAQVDELNDVEKAEADLLTQEIVSFDCWQVLRDDFSKAVVYTRPEQVLWEEVEKGEFGEIVKAKSGVYKLTPENKKLGRIGQKYGEGKKEEEVSKEEKSDMTALREHSKKIGEKVMERESKELPLPKGPDKESTSGYKFDVIHEKMNGKHVITAINDKQEKKFIDLTPEEGKKFREWSYDKKQEFVDKKLGGGEEGEELKKITNEFGVRDALGGDMSGDYKKDLERVQKQSGKTFSEELYNEAYQNQEQP